MINICSVKNVIVFPQKYCWGGGMFVHPKKEPTHTEKMALTWRERTSQIEKNAPIREKATPMDFFIHPPPPRASAYSCSLLSPGERLLLSLPLGAPIMTVPPPLTLFFFLENFKKSAKITEKTFFWLFHFTITYQILIFSFVNINVLINSHLIQ